MNKAETYRKMLAYLSDQGADLGPHATARLASVPEAEIEDMDSRDLMHYQRVLEATIDHRNDLVMDKEAMRDELAEVVRERFERGYVNDKLKEAAQYRQRFASLS